MRRSTPNFIGQGAIAVGLLCGPLASQEPPTASSEGESPQLPELAETVHVVSELLGDTFSPDSLSTAVVHLSDAISPSSAVEAAVAIPGVSENGQAGLFQVLSIRGVSRQRLLSFVDGVRITSERRAGVAASFIDPTLLGEIEVARGPATTYYGSGALGGALQLFTTTYSQLGAQAGWDSQGDEHFQNLSWGNDRFSVALANRKAGDSKTSSGTVLFSRYQQSSGTARLRWGGGESSHDAMFVGSYGKEIGKASLDFPARTTVYPRERHGLVRYQLEKDARWRGRLWTHSQDLTTEVLRPLLATRNLVETSSVDFGGLFEHQLVEQTSSFDGRYGLDYFARRDVTSKESAFGGQKTTMQQSSSGAAVDELAAYSVVNWSVARARFELGGRWTEGWQRNGRQVSGLDQIRRQRTAVTGFLGFSVPLGDRIELVANLGRGQRFPSLSEQFFVGSTGRGKVLGNPNLKQETSTNVEASVRIVGRRGAWSGALYRNRIGSYIERVDLGPGLLSFTNLSSGRIIGAELEGFLAFGGQAPAGSSWRLEGSGHWIDGEGDDGQTLDDIPAGRLKAGVVWHRGRFSSRTGVEWRAAKSEFGPGERAIGSAWLVDHAVSFEFERGLLLSFQFRNLLDREYFPSADDKAPAAAGRSAGLILRWRGR